ncbi:WD40 repeat domain-containing protein, partial [Candidatus Poribacteria bacterium]|nr:WD40 repeat domain-containing protein [Candidatus Poribacteria bacterium]
MARFRTLVACVLALTALGIACGGDQEDPPTSVNDADALAFVYASRPTTPVLVVYKSGEALTVLSEDGGATASGAVFSAPGLAALLVEGGDDDLPARAYVQGYTFIFRNWHPTMVDVGVVDPAGLAAGYTRVPWPETRIASRLLGGSASAKSAVRAGRGLINAAACVIGEVAPILSGDGPPPIAAVACRRFAANATVMVLIEGAPDSPWSEGMTLADTALANAGCTRSHLGPATGCVDAVLMTTTAAVNEANGAARLTGQALRALDDPVRVGPGDPWTGGELLATLPAGSGYINSTVFSPDGDILATGGATAVKLWDVKARAEIAKLHTLERPSKMSVAFSPDGDTLAMGRGWGVALWDVRAEEEVAVLRGHEWNVWCVAFSPDGRTIASGDTDDTVKLWDVKSRQEIATLEGSTFSANAVAFSPDGRILATASYGREGLKLWNVSRAKEIATLEGHADNARSIAFSPDGAFLASGSDDGTVKVWDVKTQREVTTLDDGRPREGRSGAVYAVAFSPDGQTLASGVRDRTVHLWDTDGWREIATLTAHTRGV